MILIPIFVNKTIGNHKAIVYCIYMYVCMYVYVLYSVSDIMKVYSDPA